MPLLVFVALCVLAVAYQAARRPFLRRLAIRDATRRPSEAVLVIAGSLLGTALITGSLIVGDTLDSSIEATAFTQLGPVDEVVTLQDPSRAQELVDRLEARDDNGIDGVVSIVSAQASFATQGGGARLAEPDTQVIELDFDRGRDFGGDPAATGISGETPGRGEVVVGEDLASRLEVEVGERVSGFLYGSELDLEVTQILPRLGLAGYWTGLEGTSTNAFVAPGTLDDLMGRKTPRNAVPPATSVLVSNEGGVKEGASRSDAVAEVITEELGGDSVHVHRVKQETLDEAEAQGEEFGSLFLAIGSFAIIAGTLLLVNIFVMLAEERKSQLGMLRAVGMRRSFLVRAFIIEGTMYAVAASVVGALVGIGVGWAIVKLAAPIFGSFEDFALDLRFDFEAASLIQGFSQGLLGSLLTIALTSVRISRINIIRAIRDLPEPVDPTTRRRTRAFGIVVAALAGAWFVSSMSDGNAWAGAILGLPIAVYALVPVLSGFVGKRAAWITASTVGLGWGILGNGILGGTFFDAGEMFAFVLQGVLLTFSAVMLLSQLQENLGSFVRRVAARRLPVRLSVAYPLARRFRTGLTLGMFALVIFTMTFIAVLSNVFGGQIDTAVRKEGGFDVLATSSQSSPVNPVTLRDQEGVETVAGLLSGSALWTAGPVTEPQPWPASAIDRDFVAGGTPALSELDEEYASDEDAWDAILEDPTKVIVAAFFLQEGGGGPPSTIIEVGDRVRMIDPRTGEGRERTIVAFVENDWAFSGAYMSKNSMREVLGDLASPNRYYIKVEEGADEDAVARRLQGSFVENGLEADAIRSLIEDFLGANLQFFQLMQAYLALGLIVGIAGLGVVMIRAVRDRRREVGVLRALGFVPPQVRLAFVLESAFVAIEGILIGALLALVTASQLIATGEFGEDISFQVPWTDLAVVTSAALIASLLSTAWPAQQASRIPPATALRIAD